MKEITREQANEILIESRKGPMKKCTICYAGKWYDIRGMSESDILKEISGLLKVDADGIPQITMNITI